MVIASMCARSPGYGDDRKICKAVRRNGGVCGGGGIVWSRAAILQFWKTEPNLSGFNESIQVDPSISCLLAAANIPIRSRPYSVINYDVNQPLKDTSAAITHVIGADGLSVAQTMKKLMHFQSLEK